MIRYRKYTGVRKKKKKRNNALTAHGRTDREHEHRVLHCRPAHGPRGVRGGRVHVGEARQAEPAAREAPLACGMAAPAPRASMSLR